jgi:CMP-N-acetylneuraminic acid synthetase
MKTVAMVPVKLHNERAPGKNIRPFFDGTPLIQCLLKTLVCVSGLDDIYVFCSDKSIQNYLINGVKFLQRPAWLDNASATPQDIIREFIQVVEADVYMVSHVTSPFVSRTHFEECIEAVLRKGFDSSFTGEKIQKLLWEKNQPLNFDAANVPRTQDLPPIFAEVSAAYVFKKEVFLTLNRRIGANPHITAVGGVESIDIDYPEDFMLADAVYKEIISKIGGQ